MSDERRATVEKVKVPYNYLGYQFIPSGDLVRDILADIGKLVETGRITKILAFRGLERQRRRTPDGRAVSGSGWPACFSDP